MRFFALFLLVLVLGRALLYARLDVCHVPAPERAVLGGPAVVELLDRYGVEEEVPGAALLAGEDEVGSLQDLEVFEDRDATDVEVGSECGDRHAGGGLDQVQHSAA